MNKHEGQLLKMARKGSVKAFEELTAPHQRIVYNYLLLNCANESEACQLAQDVFVRVFEMLTSDAVDSDLFACIYRTAVEVLRQQAGASKMIS
ncbi:MAG TPA: hypothetical protein PK127_04380 [Clostridiales bacterium]|nr:hypothetical protein [Clostridiales bacterium]HPV01697.1 hypothetical protein [Clostridiales bacterium]